MNQKQRIQELEKLIKNDKPIRHSYVVYKSQGKECPAYWIPTKYLIYNKYNGRILSLVKSFEKQFRELNPELTKDIEVIEKFLWESHAERNETTKKDLEKPWGQKKVGIVTKDGIIIDGNRRAMLLKKIAKDRNEVDAFFIAVILDDKLDDNPREIMRLETKYQMGEDEKVDYSPIEKYLKCKDLKAAGFSFEEIRDMMGEKSVRIIQEWDSIMDLMDSYLDSLGYSNIYTRLDKKEGQFVDLNKYLKAYADDNGKPTGTAKVKWNYKSIDLADLKAISFDYIRADYEGKEFRAIANPSQSQSFFCEKDVWEKFRDEHFKTIQKINEKEDPVEEMRKKNPNADLVQLLRSRDIDWKDKTKDYLKGNLGKSQYRLDNITNSNMPAKLLDKILDIISTINTRIDAFYTDEILIKIKEINGVMWDFQKLFKGKNKKH